MSNETVMYYQQLHKSLDALLADFIYHNPQLPSQVTALELAEWAKDRVDNERKKGNIVGKPPNNAIAPDG